MDAVFRVVSTPDARVSLILLGSSHPALYVLDQQRLLSCRFTSVEHKRFVASNWIFPPSVMKKIEIPATITQYLAQAPAREDILSWLKFMPLLPPKKERNNNPDNA